jgi:hypothetical protein
MVPDMPLRDLFAAIVRAECLLIREELRVAITDGDPARSAAPATERPPLTDDRAWSVEDVGYFLGVSASEVRKLEREGKLPALPRYCNRLLFDPKAVRAFREGSLDVVELKRTRTTR